MIDQLPCFCVENDCQHGAHCLSCERCVEHCLKAFGCDYKSFGDLDPVAPAIAAMEVETKPTCFGCSRELCAELDQYWGRDTYWGRFCSKCRAKRMKS